MSEQRRCRGHEAWSSVATIRACHRPVDIVSHPTVASKDSEATALTRESSPGLLLLPVAHREAKRRTNKR